MILPSEAVFSKSLCVKDVNNTIYCWILSFTGVFRETAKLEKRAKQKQQSIKPLLPVSKIGIDQLCKCLVECCYKSISVESVYLSCCLNGFSL